MRSRRSAPDGSLLAPEDTSAVYFLDLGGDSVFGAVVGDGSPACLDRVIVVDDAEATGRQPRVEPVERLNRGLVQVAIEPQYGDALDRGVVKGVLEPTGKEADLPVQQPVPFEVGLDVRLRHGEDARVPIQPNPLVLLVLCGVRRRHARERIGHTYGSRLVSV